jgi:phosphate transport system permease protein
VPIGVGAAIYLTEYTREGAFTRVIRFGTESLAGVPSIIFGLFGFIFFVTTLQMGWSLLAGALTLALMVLPTIIRTTEESIRTVPRSYRDTGYSLGATRWEMVSTTVLPTALPGIVTGVILAFGRAVSETAAVIFTAGTALNLPTSIFSPVRTMAVHFYILAVEGISLNKAYATGTVLIITILAINAIANYLVRRVSKRVGR